jgi:hypothetical protein
MSVMWGMPGRKHAEQYMIVLADPGFYIGMRYFAKGQHVARDDPLADRILKECPTWSPRSSISRSSTQSRRRTDMASSPLKGGKPAPTEAQPGTLPPKLLDNPPTNSLAQALAQSKRQVDAGK